MDSIPDYHRYTKEAYKDKFFDNEKEMSQFLSRYENLIEDYDMSDVKNFLRTIGINPDYKVIVLSSVEFQEAAKNTPSHLPINPISLGENQNTSRVIVINQKLNLEVQNGRKLFTQAIIAHEIAHIDAYAYTLTKYEGKIANIQNKRNGFGVNEANTKKIQNVTLEEGFAALVQEKYLINNWNDYPVSKQYPNPKVLINISKDNGKYITSPGGLFIDDGSLNFFSPSIPLGCLKILIYLNPKIEEVLFEARKSLKGLRNLALEIDSIEKGLYVKIRGGNYNSNVEMADLTSYLLKLEEMLAPIV